MCQPVSLPSLKYFTVLLADGNYFIKIVFFYGAKISAVFIGKLSNIKLFI